MCTCVVRCGVLAVLCHVERVCLHGVWNIHECLHLCGMCSVVCACVCVCI